MQITNGMEYKKTNTQLFTLLVMGLIKRRFKQRTFVEGNNYKAGIKLVRFDSVFCMWRSKFHPPVYEI